MSVRKAAFNAARQLSACSSSQIAANPSLIASTSSALLPSSVLPRSRLSTLPHLPQTAKVRESLSEASSVKEDRPSNEVFQNSRSTLDKARRESVRIKLADIEATRGGVVSPFLTDTFGREHDYLRISLTEKCNLRCTYCMPDEGAPLSPKEHLLSADEIIELASVFVANGVRKIRLTGGEPTVRKDLVDIVRRLSNLGLDSLGMTSNGIALSRKLPALVEAGLTHLNISLDTLDEHQFELMTRRRGHSAVLKTIQEATALVRNGQLRSLKINVVVINKLNDHEVPAFVEFAKDLPLSVRFIEYMPFDGNHWSTTKLVPSTRLLANIASHYPIGQVEAITPGISETARTYRVKGHQGTFGFISSMTDHFCAGCSRLRLGADGRLKVCLFGEPTLSLREMLRSGASQAELGAAIGSAVKNKKFAHDGRSGLQDRPQTPLPSSASAASLARLTAMKSATGSRLLARNGARNGFYTTLSSAWLPGMPLHGMIAQSARLLHTGKTRCSESVPRNQAKLTHLSSTTGKPTMVSVSDKASTVRSATAVGRVSISRVAYALLQQQDGTKRTAKGDVFTVAQLAGIMASKKTSDLIPLCHPLFLSSVQVDLQLQSSEAHGAYIEVNCTAECVGATGVEMEALTGVSIACLTIWDMLKAVDGRTMRIENIRVTRKTGGKSGDWSREDP